MNPLTHAQRRALRKLKSAWQDKKAIGERRSTLDALVDRKLANRNLAISDRVLPRALWRITPKGTCQLIQEEFESC